MPLLSTTQSNLIIAYVTLFIAYLTAIACAGGTQAWLAKVFGDDTPEEAGFLTFNPIYHVHIIGMIMFVLLGVGLGPIQPINPTLVSPQWKELKLVCIYLIKSIVNVCLATISLVTMLVIFCYGESSIQNINTIKQLIALCFQSGSTPISAFYDAPRAFLTSFSDMPTFVIVCGILLLALMFSNVIAAPFNFVVNGSYCMLAIGQERQSRYVEYLQYFLIFGPFIVLFFFGGFLLQIFLHITLAAASCIAGLLGLG